MQSAQSLADQVSIIADPDTNSLLVRTQPKNYERVKAILAELDRPVSQVLIKVLIAEVTHDNTFDIGAELSALNLRASGLGQRGGSNFGITNPANNQVLTNNGLVVQVLETDFTAAIRALEQQGKLDVLSRPYILASENQLASITVGQRVPFPTNSRILETGQSISDVDYDQIGILLDVIPHINPDGLVILDVAPTISALTDASIQISAGTNAPIFNERSAQSRVGVMNGQTVVIGGLMEDRKTEQVNKVPLLGDIPLVGNLFKRTIHRKVKTELLIFLTPHVAARPEALRGMSKDEMDGTKLVPKAVEPGAFQEHMRGMKRGATTEPTTPLEE
jgi:general secretion pathway protein D